MTEIQKICNLMYQVNKLDDFQSQKKHKKIYNACSGINSLQIPKFNAVNISKKNMNLNSNISIHAYYKCYIYLNIHFLKKNWNRDKIIKKINSKGVPCYYGSCSEIYLEKAFIKSDLMPKTRLKNAKKLGERSLMFLIHPNLKASEIKKTCEVIRKIFLDVTLKKEIN